MWCPHCQQDVAATRKLDQGLVCFRCGEKVSFSHVESTSLRSRANATSKSATKEEPEQKRELWPILASALKSEGDFGEAIQSASTGSTSRNQQSNGSATSPANANSRDGRSHTEGSATTSSKNSPRDFQSEINKELNRIENAVKAWQSNHWVRLDQAHRQNVAEKESKQIKLASQGKKESKAPSRSINLLPIIKKVAESNLDGIVTARRGALLLFGINLITFIGWSCILLDGTRTSPGTISSIGFGICFLLQFAGIFAIGWLISWLGAMIEGIRQQVGLEPADSANSSEPVAGELSVGSQVGGKAESAAPLVGKPHVGLRKVA